MNRCKYCHTVQELDSKGRCPSCAAAGDAVNVYGISYGQYMAKKSTGQIPAKTPTQERMEAALKDCIEPPRCRICGSILPPRRRVLCSVECEKEDKLRRNRSSAHGKGGPRLCPVCGKAVGPDLRKTYCSWDCYRKNARQLDAKYRARKRAEKKGNAE